MEDRRGIYTYLGGAVRIILIVLLVAILAFFVIRWARARQNTQKAEQATKTASADKSDSDQKAEENSGSSSKDTESNGGSDSIQIPKGIADSDVVAQPGESKMPDAGMDADIILTSVALAASTYFFMMYSKSARLVREQSM